MNFCNYYKNLFNISGPIAAIMGSFYIDRNDIDFGVMGEGRGLFLEFQNYYPEVRETVLAISIPSMGVALYVSDRSGKPWISIWKERI